MAARGAGAATGDAGGRASQRSVVRKAICCAGRRDSKGLRETGFVEGQNLAVEYRHADSQWLPTIYATRGAVVLGGLMSYGVPTNLTNDMYRLAGVYPGRILNGSESGESPVTLPTRFELVINGRTAKALRIAVPRRLLSRADEIID